MLQPEPSVTVSAVSREGQEDQLGAPQNTLHNV